MGSLPGRWQVWPMVDHECLSELEAETDRSLGGGQG